MLKKLRIKFIAVAMFAVTFVLALLLGCINIVNYMNVIDAADARLDVLEAYGGTFPYGDTLLSSIFRHKFSAEAPFDSRYFTVTINEREKIASVDTGHIASVDANDAAVLAYSLYQKDEEKGFTSDYRYRAVQTENGILYIFLDCSRELGTFRNFITASLVASAVGLMLVFILVFVFSKTAIKPMAEAYEKQKRFITDAGHEIKTPLAIIGAANEVIELDTGESEWTQSIRNQISRLTSLTEKLVMLSRMEESGGKGTDSVFSLSEAVRETAESFSAVAAARNRQFTVSVEPDINFSGDENAAKELTSILIDNAMKYSDENGYVNVTLRKNGKKTELTVANSVEHIEKGDHSVMFERFYRADGSRSSKTGGHGIGLSVARAIVTAHKGKITAYSPDEHTIVFTAIV